MNFIRVLKKDKPQVIKDLAFCELLDGRLPGKTKAIDTLFDTFDESIISSNAKVTKDALKNVHGDWYEWLIALCAWNYCARNEKANLPLLTPNITSLDISSLYTENLYKLIQDLRKKVLDSSSVQLISSNPDFVIIRRKLVDDILTSITPISTIDQTAINTIASAYSLFSGKCGFEDIAGYISVKTSLRPDRRLQIPHEGSLMKAIYTHLQTREWIINPIGLKYYAFATKVTAKDQGALKTVATHSITTVHSIPQAAVDEVFEINSLQQAESAFSRILND